MGFILRLGLRESSGSGCIGRSGLSEVGGGGAVLQRLLLEESVLLVVLLLVGLY
jgi:hypothetical protein